MLLFLDLRAGFLRAGFLRGGNRASGLKLRLRHIFGILIVLARVWVPLLRGSRVPVLGALGGAGPPFWGPVLVSWGLVTMKRGPGIYVLVPKCSPRPPEALWDPPGTLFHSDRAPGHQDRGPFCPPKKGRRSPKGPRTPGQRHRVPQKGGPAPPPPNTWKNNLSNKCSIICLIDVMPILCPTCVGTFGKNI